MNDKTGETIYTPPEGEQVLRSMLASWEKFLHNTVDVDPLIRMAVGHYQFEAIHPFADGNGRTGRIVNSLFLIQENLLTLPILYLSRYLIQNKADYYQLSVVIKCDLQRGLGTLDFIYPARCRRNRALDKRQDSYH